MLQVGLTKVCRKCLAELPLDTFPFSKSKQKPESYCYPCKKISRKENYERNKEKENADSRARHRANRSHNLAKQKEWYKLNHDKEIQRARKNYRVNKDKLKVYFAKPSTKARLCHNASKRLNSKRNATPIWANMVSIKAFYDHARLMSDLTGIPHEVDHIIPLQHKLVCGLHCETNLRVVTKEVNRIKNNFFKVE